MRRVGVLACLILLAGSPAFTQITSVAGTVRDETGGALPGATVELRAPRGPSRLMVTDSRGAYRFDRTTPGRYQIVFTLINFAAIRRDVDVPSTGLARVDAVLHLALDADVTVTGSR